MSLFRKKENKENNTNVSTNPTIKILGGGCKKCHELSKNAEEALKILDYNYEIEHITDFSVIATYGVMSTPALVFDNKVLSYGKVLKSDEIVSLLKQYNISE